MLSGIYSVIAPSSRKTAKRHRTGVDSAPPDRPPATARNGIRFPAAQKKDMPSAASKHVSKTKEKLKAFHTGKASYSLITFCLFSFIVSIPGTRHFQRKNNVNRKSHFSAEIRHPFFFFCILHKIQIAGKTKEIRLMCLIRLIK